MKNKPGKARTPRPPKQPLTPLKPHQSASPEITPAQEQLIGRLIVEWSRLEACLNDLIWAMLKIGIEDGRIITARADANTLITILQALAPRHAEGTVLERLLDTLKDANELREDRNFIAHGTWGVVLPDNIPIALSLRPKMELGLVASESFPQEKMRRLIEHIILTKNRLVWVLEQLRPSPDKPA